MYGGGAAEAAEREEGGGGGAFLNVEVEGERLAADPVEDVVAERPSEGGPPPDTARFDCTIRAKAVGR